jgi:uncharacterized coiled-coil protein SlyX
MRIIPNMEVVLFSKINELEHTVVNQDQIIAGQNQEFADLRKQRDTLEARARSSEVKLERNLTRTTRVQNDLALK